VDLTETIAPKSDQLNADDLIAHPVTVTIAEVRKGSAEQPVEVHLVEYPGRPYKPSKTMRRVMVSAWGLDASTYTGRRLTLFRNPEITFGGQTVGGIEISHLSHIDKRLTLALTSTRGKKSPHVIEPLPDAPPAPTADDIATTTDRAALGAMWKANPGLRAQIEERVAELDGAS